jgi:hypothetical protein
MHLQYAIFTHNMTKAGDQLLVVVPVHKSNPTENVDCSCYEYCVLSLRKYIRGHGVECCKRVESILDTWETTENVSVAARAGLNTGAVRHQLCGCVCQGNDGVHRLRYRFTSSPDCCGGRRIEEQCFHSAQNL